MTEKQIRRRDFLGGALAAAAAAGPPRLLADDEPFKLRYILASSMYGRLPLADVVEQAPKLACTHIDIWPRKHADHREQMEAMGYEKFADLLRRHGVRLGILTHYDLGPFRLREEMAVARKLGATMLISGGMPPTKSAARAFVEKMKPHVAAAEKRRVVIGIENHGEPPDAIRRFAEVAKSKHLGVALAPYHLPQEPALLARLIGDLGPKLVHFYAWQHGKGCHKKLPKEQELLQMPGRGRLDFVPIVAALRKIRYAGWTSPFMHPVPRGIPILPTAAAVTAEIRRAQKYLNDCLAKTTAAA